MSQTYETVLEPHVRGRRFKRLFTLTDPWVGANLTSVKFTLRTAIPESGVGDDRDAVAQVSDDDGITFEVDVGTAAIPARRQRGWPLGVLYWDLVGVSNGEPDTIDSGTIEIVGAVTKAT